ncbi:MAG: serine/threonine protein kinase [Myxococcales bacterium]|nr:MAG: serine/threonine protein kinase [Myxococcales bacterium]
MSPTSSAAQSSEPDPAETSAQWLSSTGMSYRPLLELGEGGMAKVYLASAKGPGGFNKLVVLKSMRESDLDDDAIRQMFVDEARLSARFNHPNLVQVQEVSLDIDPPFLVMEYLDGKPLSALRTSESVSLGMRLAIISEVLTGLEYAHTLRDFDGAPLGIVHRDVSPHNVFVTYDGIIKVLDFGIAKMVTNSTRTEAGEVKGKLAYMAPEQMLGAEIDCRADVFAVGSMLWEAAVGKRMWDGISEAQLMHRLAIGEIPRPSQFGDVDPELEEMITKATAPEPKDRYPSARAMQQELDSYRTRSGQHSSIRDIGSVLADSYQTERRRQAELISAALQTSLLPPPLELEDELVEEVAPPPSRVRWLLPAALLLLAVSGVAASRFWSTGAAAASDATPPLGVAPPLGNAQPLATTAPGAAPSPSPSGTVTPGSAVEATRAAEPTPEGSAEPASSATDKPSRAKSPRGVRPAGPAAAPAPAAAPPAAPPPAASEGCNPPYYFSRGIKTYKPECL